ncbi:MAG: CoA-transferase subunit beta [Gammaproteobacteria bacterium]
MTIVAARYLHGNAVCFVGIGLPSAAANLARLTHAGDIVLIYESGTIGAKPDVLPLSIGDSELAETADFIVPVPEMFRYWLQGGRISMGFLGAAQIDKYANINTTVIGAYEQPQVRLPGAGGGPEIAACCAEVLITLRHSKRAFVENLDFITTVGHYQGNGSRQGIGLHNQGPTAVITDLGILQPEPVTRELTLTHRHPGVTIEQVRDATGWPLKCAVDISETEPPTEFELSVLRALNERTQQAHTG